MFNTLATLSMVVFGATSDVPISPKPIIALEAPYVETIITTDHKETLEEMADRIAIQHNISTSTLRNLVYSESRWDIKADNGKDRGLVQINRDAWPEITDEQAFDPEFSLNFAADKISKGEEHKWVVCSCWALVKTKVPNLPNMAKIIPNKSKPKSGRVLVMQYGNLKHVAYIEKVGLETLTIIEANYESCLVGRREIPITDMAIVGYFGV